MKKKSLIFILVSMFVLFLSMSFASQSAERIPVKYVKTSDGDTMRAVLDGENIRIRFLGINTPEVSGEDKVEEPWGNEALAYTQKRLNEAKKIEIEYDTVADHEDRFGRKLAWIWVDDELFELELLEQGLAKTYMLKNNYKYAKELKAAEQKAKNAKVGVWGENIPSESTIVLTEKETFESSSKERNLEESQPNSIPQEKNSIPSVDNSSPTIEFEEVDNSITDDIISIVIALIILGVIVFFVKKNSKKLSK